ncbi:hypothetical protein PHJA_002188100 [Phtheirospermum japonicum]|uniref:Uncharacterized protein n=1 Tax=Phtheirospermum japonicum TaxID=374723 RepID=A0A830CKV1_9LAMI|nr:hypothetical protein PHJA_002188100 [Phtheirospermum japonicum]
MSPHVGRELGSMGLMVVVHSPMIGSFGDGSVKAISSSDKPKNQMVKGRCAFDDKVGEAPAETSDSEQHYSTEDDKFEPSFNLGEIELGQGTYTVDARAPIEVKLVNDIPV